jgi:tetratricopeptide (TPR) repeat protein
VLVDLNSQNGLWVDGRRLNRVRLTPKLPVTLGPYRLVLEAPAVVPVTTPAAASAPATAKKTGDTVSAPAVTAPAGLPKPMTVPAALPNPVPAAAAAPARAKRAEGMASDVRPGPIAWLARQSKPVLAAMAVGVVVFIIVMGQLLAPKPKTTTGLAAAGSGAAAAPVDPDAKLTNDQVVAMQLADARAMMGRGDFDGAIAALDRVFLVDPNQAEALDLKVRAEESRRTKAAAPVSAGTAPAAAASSSNDGGQGATIPAPAKPQDQAPRPSVTPDPRIARKPGEPIAAWRARGRQVEQYYSAGVAAIRRKDFPAAVASFQQVEALAPGFNDVPTLLARARDEVDRSHRETVAAVQQLVEEGNRQEAAGDLLAALKQFEQAHQLDSSAVAADVGVRRIRQKMAVAGQDAFKKARQYDALGRTADALTLYQQAVQLLPADDPQTRTAQDRIAALRNAR